MKILLFGASGTIGSEIKKLRDCVCPTSQEVDIRSAIQVDEIIKSERPDCVINMSGLASPSECLSDPDESYLRNVISIRNICDSSARHCLGSQIINAGSILEITNGRCLYARHKQESLAVAMQYSRLLDICHLRLCTTENGRRKGFFLSFLVDGLTRFLETKEKFSVHDLSCPKWVSSASAVASTIHNLIGYKKSGTFYVGPRMSMSVEEIVCKLAEHLGLTMKRYKNTYRDEHGNVVFDFQEFKHSVIDVSSFGTPRYTVPQPISDILGI